MRCTSNNSKGFTLVEVLIISPIIILFIGMFIGLLVNLTGDSLTVRERNLAVYDTQAALDDIQADISTATGFLSTTSATSTSPYYLPAPQGKDNATSQVFTDTSVDGSGNRLPDALILTSAATTKSPNDPTREIVYLGSGACDSKNPAYTYLTIYFVDFDTDTADTTDKALFKRTALPPASACDSPWQKGSCKREAMAGNPTICKEKDEKLISGISDLDVKYFSSTNTIGSDTGATTATDASINISVAKQVAGSAVNYSSSTRTSGSNIQAVDSSNPAPTPTNAPIQVSGRTSTDPYRTTITWSRIGNATGYTAKYKIGTGAIQNATIAQTGVGVSPTFNIDAAYRKQTVQLTELKVQTPSGTFDYGTLPSISDIPSWNDCTMPNNGWANYGSIYNTMGFTRTSSGAVGLKGLVQSGTLGYTPSTTVCTLPVGFRPTEHVIFQQPAAGPSGDTAARVDVFPDGRVQIYYTPYGGPGYTNSPWVSMDGLIFMTSAGNPSWTNANFYNSWYFYDYSDGYGTPRFFKDSLGRVWLQGLATGGSQSAIMNNIPAGMLPDGGMHYPSYSSNGPNAINIRDSAGNGVVMSRSSGSYLPTQSLYYASSVSKYALPLYNSWLNYNNGWTTAQCLKGADDIVVLQGLVNNGNTATYITNITGCAGGASATMSTGKDAILGGVAYSGGAGVDRAYRIDLSTNTYMYPIGGGASSGWTSLDGVHYIAN